MSAQPETWRVSTIEGVFEADLETLRQWILEGCVQPTDKVTKGNMNWIEAGKAPMLRAAFAGERVPISMPTVPAVIEAFPEVGIATPAVNEVPAGAFSPDLAPANFPAAGFATPDLAPNAFPDDSGSPEFC